MAKSKSSKPLKSWQIGEYTLVGWSTRQIVVNHPNQPQRVLYLFDSFIGRVELTDNNLFTKDNNPQEIWLLQFILKYLDKMELRLGQDGFFIKFPTPGRVIIYRCHSTDINLKFYRRVSQTYLFKLIKQTLEIRLSKRMVDEI